MPSLTALIGVPMVLLERMIYSLFCFAKQGARHPPMLLVGGDLRPQLHATLATMIMYYPERFEAKEMHTVLHQMREAYKDTIGAPGDDAHSKLVEWGVAIKTKFDVDNLHLTDGTTHEGAMQVVQAVKSLGSSTASTQAMIADVAVRQIRMEESQTRIETKLDMIIGMLKTSSPSSPAPATTAAAPSATPVNTVASSIPSVPAIPASSPAGLSAAAAAVAGTASAGTP